MPETSTTEQHNRSRMMTAPEAACELVAVTAAGDLDAARAVIAVLDNAGINEALGIIATLARGVGTASGMREEPVEYVLDGIPRADHTLWNEATRYLHTGAGNNITVCPCLGCAREFTLILARLAAHITTVWTGSGAEAARRWRLLAEVVAPYRIDGPQPAFTPHQREPEPEGDRP
jgi:hypothetical protein